MFLGLRAGFSLAAEEEPTSEFAILVEDVPNPDDSDELVDDESRRFATVHVVEHGFLSDGVTNWLPRGSMTLIRTVGDSVASVYEARLSDAQEFVLAWTQQRSILVDAATNNSYYAVRMYRQETPDRVLHASIPAKLLADHYEDWHDILEVTIGANGAPVSLSYRVKHTLGLMLFDHTQVRLIEPCPSLPPRSLPREAPAADGSGQAPPQSDEETNSRWALLRRYWWVALIVGLVLVRGADDPGRGQAQQPTVASRGEAKS